MIVCVCHAVNDRALDTVIESGARSVRQVGDACGAGTDCGQCCREIADRLRSRSGSTRREDTAPLSK